jgi:type II secretory pathway pseudopilin PulG
MKIASPRSKETGFSLIEMLVSVGVLVVILGAVFNYAGRLQTLYKTQETAVDATQELRTFFDSIQREIHQAGFPSQNGYAFAILASPAVNDSRVAAGLVSLSKWELWFEGDIDNDGIVDSVRYTLLDNNGNIYTLLENNGNIATAAGSCPCTLQRTVKKKTANGAPSALISAAEVTTLGAAGLSNVINSADENNGNALTIAGSTVLSGSSVANNTLYAAYKTAPVFSGFKSDGVLVALPASATDLSNVRAIAITASLLTNYIDRQTQMRQPLTMKTTVKLNNY